MYQVFVKRKFNQYIYPIHKSITSSVYLLHMQINISLTFPLEPSMHKRKFNQYIYPIHESNQFFFLSAHPNKYFHSVFLPKCFLKVYAFSWQFFNFLNISLKFSKALLNKDITKEFIYFQPVLTQSHRQGTKMVKTQSHNTK